MKVRALDRILKSRENEVRKQLLCECVEVYLSLEGPAIEEYEHLLLTERFPEVRAMAMTTYEKGRVEGQRALIQEQLEVRFGPLSPTVVMRLSEMAGEELRQLGKAVITINSLKELGLEDS